MNDVGQEVAENEKIVPTMCASHCGGSCLLKVHVKDGVITRIETDDGDEPQLRACLRGRALRKLVYAPDRLLYPMKRVGARGEGRFERITWGEALDRIVAEMKRVRDTYGPGAVWLAGALGDVHYLHRVGGAMQRFASMAGFALRGVASQPWLFQYGWSSASFGQGVNASQVTYGTIHTCNTRNDLVNSRFIILWGWDPAWTVSAPNTCWYLAQAREAGARLVSVNPKYTDTAVAFADEWIPIRPGTDAAMLIAMAHVMIKEELHDERFLNTYTVGFDRYRDYVLGVEDGVAKTPAWAEAITGVPAATIEKLARDYATIKPAALMAGTAPGRTAYGEQHHRAAITLAAMTGNVGVHGGDAAGRAWESVYPGILYPLHPIDYALRKGLVGSLPNPVAEAAAKAAGPPPPPPTPQRPPMHGNQLAGAILRGEVKYKMMFAGGGSILTQTVNTNVVVKALNTMEFIAIMEQFMTPAAKFADILLPATTFFERNDVTYGTGAPFIGKINKAIEPVGECRDFLLVLADMAERLDVKGFLTKTEDEMIEEFAIGNGVQDYAELKRTGVYRYKQSEPEVVFKKQIEDPANNPFPTPSGKIEIYSQQMADFDLPGFPPIPKYIEAWEGRNDPLAKKYPFQLITTHFKRRALSKFDSIPWLREVQTQAVLINTADAQARSIKDGEWVRVFNDRGQLAIPARVSERIMPGVVEVPHGSWYKPDKNGLDWGGNANVLTGERFSPAGGHTYNTALVEVEKLKERPPSTEP